MCCTLKIFEEEEGEALEEACTGTSCRRLLQEEFWICEEETLLGKSPTEAAEEIPESESSC